MKIRALHGMALGGLVLAGCLVSRVDTALPGPHPLSSLPLAAGDLNGDGLRDLVAGHRPVADEAGELRGASVLISQGDGSFQSSLLPVFDAVPNHLLLEDYSGDGRLDLVVSTRYADGLGDVQLFLGTGQGDFTPGPVLAATIAARGMASGDLDGDGKLDLIVSDGDPRRLLVFMNLGKGTFGAEQAYPDIFSGSIAAGDLNGDGAADVVLAKSGGVGVMLSDGSGALSPMVSYPGSTDIRALALADLDLDGHLDVVTADRGDNAVSVFRGQGDGTLSGRQSHPAGESPEDVAVGLVDGDPRPDVVTTNSGKSSVTVLRGADRGVFRSEEPLEFQVGAGPSRVLLSDVTGDGRPEVVTGNRQDGTITVLLDKRYNP